MTLENWPPGPDNETGVGLVWDGNSLNRLLGEQDAASAETNKDSLAMVKLSEIPSPADTVYLTEAINPNNNIKDTQSAAVSGPGTRWKACRRRRHRNNSIWAGLIISWRTAMWNG